jgi:hypothetical protein
MIERTIAAGVVIVVAASMLASILPRITPSLLELGVVVLVARVVWFYTR